MGLLAPLFLCRESPSHSQSMPKYFKILTKNICIFAGCDCECDFQPAQRVVNVFQNVPVSVFSLQSQGAKCYPDIEKKNVSCLISFTLISTSSRPLAFGSYFTAFSVLELHTILYLVFPFTILYSFRYLISFLCARTHIICFSVKREFQGH